MPSHNTSGFSLSQSPPQACDMSQGLWAYYKTVINAFNLWFVCGYSEDCRQEILVRFKPELWGKCVKKRKER